MVLVQVVKEPIGTKGAKVNARVSLPGRYLVLVPGVSYVGVSRKIMDRDERSRQCCGGGEQWDARHGYVRGL